MRSPEEYEDGLTGVNAKYDSVQTIPFQGYSPSETPYKDPADVVYFSGFGANADDLERGYIKPMVKESPQYVLENYKQKWTQYRVLDEDGDGGMDLPAQLEFRNKDRETKGLFVRPHIPTER